MDRDVFILSAISKTEPAEAIRLALENIDVKPSRVGDAVFGYDGSFSLPNVEQITKEAGLSCPAVNVSSSLRAVFFAAQSILSGDQELAVVVGLGGEGSTALLLASPDTVGRFNLLPRAAFGRALAIRNRSRPKCSRTCLRRCSHFKGWGERGPAGKRAA